MFLIHPWQLDTVVVSVVHSSLCQMHLDEKFLVCLQPYDVDCLLLQVSCWLVEEGSDWISHDRDCRDDVLEVCKKMFLVVEE